VLLLSNVETDRLVLHRISGGLARKAQEAESTFPIGEAVRLRQRRCVTQPRVASALAGLPWVLGRSANFTLRGYVSVALAYAVILRQRRYVTQPRVAPAPAGLPWVFGRGQLYLNGVASTLPQRWSSIPDISFVIRDLMTLEKETVFGLEIAVAVMPNLVFNILHNPIDLGLTDREGTIA
jgi:hypothetical protein